MEELVEALILKKPPITLAAIHRKVAEIAQEKGCVHLTYRVVRDIAQKIDPALVLLAHEGSKVYNQKYELIYLREATAPNEICKQIFFYRKEFNNHSVFLKHLFRH